MWTDGGPHPLEKGNKPSHYPTDIPKTYDDLVDAWDNNMSLNAKRLILFAPDITSWSNISDVRDNTLHFTSKAGEGLEDFEMDQILDGILESI